MNIEEDFRFYDDERPHQARWYRTPAEVLSGILLPIKAGLEIRE